MDTLSAYSLLACSVNEHMRFHVKDWGSASFECVNFFSISLQLKANIMKKSLIFFSQKGSSVPQTSKL